MDLTELLNTIRDNASQQYQDRIPEATRTNIAEVQEAMADPNNAVVANEFASALLNMIIKQVIISKLFSDPLKSLKKGTKPLGDTVEEIYTNFIKAKQYDPTGEELLSRELPDVKAIYHRMNRQDKYKVTISPEQLYKAFASYDKLNSFIQSIINTLYNSSELDEFVLMKQIIKQALDNNAMVEVTIPDPLESEQNGKAFIKAVKTVSGGMEFPNTIYNAYLTSQDTDEVPITTFSKKNEQILIIDNATNVSLNVDVLATVFNMSVAEFNDTRKIVIDAFPDPDVRACLVDEMFFQVYDDLVTFRDFENGEGLYRNYYLHVWQTLAYSTLVNAVCFRVGSDEDQDGQVESFSVSYTLADGVKSSNKRTTVTEGTKYSTTLTGVTEDMTVGVTMNGNDVTASAYDSETGKITILKATGNIVITVEESEPPVETASITFTNNTASIIVSLVNPATEVEIGGSYESVIMGFNSSTMETTVTMNNVDVSESAFDTATGTVSISEVTGDITIVVSDVTPAIYSVTFTNNSTSVITSSNSDLLVNGGESYTTTLNGVTTSVVDVSVTMGGVDVTATAYNSGTGVVSIASVDGNIVILVTDQSNDPVSIQVP